MGKVVDETVAYDRYLTVFDRTVEFPEDSMTVKYDIVGHPRANFRFAVIFPFHPGDAASKTPATVTVIREYIQASNAMGYSLPTGGFNPKKRASLGNAASDELAEEARLEGRLIDMLDAIDLEHPGFVEGKWCSNRFRPYLAVDPRPMAHPPKRDAEEFSIETSRVTFPELKRLMYSGEMMVPSIVTANMAIERLLKEGLGERASDGGGSTSGGSSRRIVRAGGARAPSSRPHSWRPTRDGVALQPRRGFWDKVMEFVFGC